MLRFELKRCFRGSGFWFSIIMGMLFVTVHVMAILNYYEDIGGLDETIRFWAENEQLPASAIKEWMGITHKWPKQVYIFLIPIFATLPYAVSYHMDRKTGYIHQVVAKTGKKTYLAAKYVTVFLSGFTAVLFPLVLDLFAMLAMFPANQLFMYSNMTNTLADSLWGDLFWSHHYIYVAVFILVDSIIGGLVGCLALSISKIVENVFLISLFPLLSVLFFSSVMEAIGQYELTFQNIMDAASMIPAHIRGTGFYAIAILVLFLVTFLPFWMTGKEEDI